jgi:hypothetical protein
MTNRGGNGNMQSNAHNPLDEFFQMFGNATRSELITLREFLATEQVSAWAANDVMLAAAIDKLVARIEILLERIEQRELMMATQEAEFSGVN